MWGDTMGRIAFCGAALGALLAAAAAQAQGQAQAQAQAPSWTVPAENQRCPSKWGAADERGSVNHQKAAAVLNASKLIKTGEVIELAHVLGPSMAFFGTRRFDVHIKRTFMNQFSNMRGSNEEIIITELGQVGTQFDTSTAGTIASRSTRTRPAPASTSSASTMSARCSRGA
jgi:hypothetical protein